MHCRRLSATMYDNRGTHISQKPAGTDRSLRKMESVDLIGSGHPEQDNPQKSPTPTPKTSAQARPPSSFVASQTERLVRHHTQPCTPKSSAASNEPLATSHCTSKTQSRPAPKPGLRSPGYAALLKSFSRRSPVSRAAGAPGTPTRCCDIREHIPLQAFYSRMPRHHSSHTH